MTGMLIAIESISRVAAADLADDLVVSLEWACEIDPRHVLTTRAPGGTHFCQAVQSVIASDHHGEDIPPLSQAMLVTAARAQLVETIIKPALAQGMVVICEGYIARTLAELSHKEGLSREFLLGLQTDFPKPDLTLLLDRDPDASIARMPGQDQGAQREPEAATLQRQIRAGLLKGLGDTRLSRYTQVINSAQPASEVLWDALRHIKHIRGVLAVEKDISNRAPAREMTGPNL